MKAASFNTLSILAGGKWLLAELYDLTLSIGTVYRLTSFQVPLSAAIYPSATKHLYQTGLTIKRETIHQKLGLQAGQLQVSVSPQADSPSSPVLVAGYPILQAARYGFLDGATLQLSKLFMSFPALGGAFDTSPGAVAWMLGTIQKVEADRLTLKITADDYLTYLANQQMPNKVYGPGCFHQVYDAGCTLLKTSFTVAGSISTAGDGAHFTVPFTTYPTNYFNLGVLTFTSGVNNGLSAGVAQFTNIGGGLSSFVMRNPFPKVPGGGDTFNVYPGCDLQLTTCMNNNSAIGPPFNNLAHYGGQDFLPVPETLIDGGTTNPPPQEQGAQAGQIVGSPGSGRPITGPYRP
jgi:hypothetical protein